jgi:hypothetical protein
VLLLDGVRQSGNSFALTNDRQEHAVILHLASRRGHSAPADPAGQ